MLYQPENYNDCIKIDCAKCILNNINICQITLKKDYMLPHQIKRLTAQRKHQLKIEGE